MFDVVTGCVHSRGQDSRWHKFQLLLAVLHAAFWVISDLMRFFIVLSIIIHYVSLFSFVDDVETPNFHFRTVHSVVQYRIHEGFPFVAPRVMHFRRCTVVECCAQASGSFGPCRFLLLFPTLKKFCFEFVQIFVFSWLRFCFRYIL